MIADREAAIRQAARADWATLTELRAELAAAREREERLRETLRAFVEAWWEYDGPDFEPLDAAAGNGMALLGDEFSLSEGQG